ncbi:MAG: ABC transporter permease [Paludibacter sp.]|nr:ABC transporter permease [Bacteroidales bacterium]MCM1068599.1 ABC transporter permease [Prevotella sp.]MCM1353263.1 ABC transporter permease [Bacteroides sp.]MCM1442329.1 ABC transporter permease [Muribaculum sp.]MCM1481148.1 ABC transporter permease [Paludibacter sp.]
MKKLSTLIGSRRTWAWPYVLFLVLFVLLPLFLIVYYAFTDAQGGWTIHNFTQFFSTSEAVNTFIYSLAIALLTTLICLLIGYPAAYIMATEEYRTPKVMAMLFILPMWINFLLRTIATVELFNMFSLPLGEGALLFGMCYDFLPFMIYPIYNTLQKMDRSLIEAAHDLGANRFEVFTKVILPLSASGIYSGIIMVFMPTVSTFAIAELLTRNKITLFGSLIQRAFGEGGLSMWNYGAALSLIMLVIIGLTSFFGNNDDTDTQKGGLL